MQLFNDPKFIDWKMIWEARVLHIVVVETIKEKIIGGDINAAIQILLQKMLMN